jgi:ATP-dependent 26S proteasome regulatory subunit
MRNYLLTLEYQGKTLTEDMFQEVASLRLALEKPLKLYIFKEVFKHFEHEGEHEHREEILQNCHDKFGWQVFKEFMRGEWERVRGREVSEVLKEIAKLVKQEQVQNLIEVSWDDVGGLENAKEEIIQTILLPIRHP